MTNDVVSTKTPIRLQKGDTLGLVTLSAPEAAENPEKVQQGIERLRGLGFSTKMGKHALSAERGYLAAHPHLLAEDLNSMFEDDSVQGIICTGGGTNANRLLPYINYETIQHHPKVLVGISNPTVVLNAITARTNVITFHGPVLVWNFGGDTFPRYTSDSFIQSVMTPETIGELPKSDSWKYLLPGRARGQLYGGNLWSLQSLLGTPYEPKWDGVVLFWEDIAKEPKRIDAMLTHFKLAGVFDRIAGMVIGELVACDATGPSLTLEEIVQDLLSDYSFPVLHGVRLGHTDEKLTLPIGAVAALDGEANSFRIEQNAVI